MVMVVMVLLAAMLAAPDGGGSGDSVNSKRGIYVVTTSI